MLFAIGTPGDLPRVPDEAMQAAADAGVEIFRLVYDPTDARWTYEINANDELLEWFPSFGDATAYPMPGWWGATEQS